MPKVTKKVAAQPVSLSADSKGLAAALSDCAKTVQNTRNAPVYRCVLLSVSADKERLTVRGTDLAVFIERHILVSASGEGVWLVPFDLFYHFISRVSGKLKLELSRNKVTMTAGRQVAEVKLRDPRDYMVWPKWSDLVPVKVDAGALIVACRQSLPSITTSFVDPVLINVSIKPYKDGQVDVQASNNHRYQMYRLSMHLKAGILIPLNAASVLSLLDDARKVALRDAMIGVETLNGRTFCTLGAGDERYPKFSGLMPKAYGLWIQVGKEELLQAVALAKGFADSKYHRVRFVVDAARKTVLLESSVKVGGVKSTLKLKQCKGKSITLLLDAEDIEKFSGLCQGVDIHMRFSDNGMVLMTDPEQPKLRFVANPLIVGDESEEKEAQPAEK